MSKKILANKIIKTHRERREKFSHFIVFNLISSGETKREKNEEEEKLKFNNL